MTVWEDIADDCFDFVLPSLMRVVPREDAIETASDIRISVAKLVRSAIDNYHGDRQNRMTDDAVAERRGLN
jgi:hypothetical protein